MALLRECRRGVVPDRPQKATKALPTLAEVLPAYCTAKKLKDASRKRYDSFFRTHFGEWLHRPLDDLRQQSFAEHCHQFAQSKGSALVELGRGVLGAVIKYVWAAAGFDDTLLRWQMKPEVVNGEKKDIQSRVQTRGGQTGR